jgi:hypothetical protein
MNSPARYILGYGLIAIQFGLGLILVFSPEYFYDRYSEDTVIGAALLLVSLTVVVQYLCRLPIILGYARIEASDNRGRVLMLVLAAVLSIVCLYRLGTNLISF